MPRVVEQVQGPEAAEPGNTVRLEGACVLQVLGESTLVAQEQLMGEALDRRAVAACACAERRNRVGAGVPEAGCKARLGAVADGRGAPRRCPLLRAYAACVRVSIHVFCESRNRPSAYLEDGWIDNFIDEQCLEQCVP